MAAGVLLGGLAGEARRQQSLKAYAIVVIAYVGAVGGLFVWSGMSLDPWVIPLVISFLLVFVLWLPKKKKAPPPPAED
ncbi:MAG: hypothetical protein GX593_04495 [Actinomycetales bacterium]|nr:hypothetical protein [Actinomycetales bacterium]